MGSEKKIFGTEYSWNDPPTLQFKSTDAARVGGRTKLNQRVAHDFSAGPSSTPNPAAPPCVGNAVTRHEYQESRAGPPPPIPPSLTSATTDSAITEMPPASNSADPAVGITVPSRPKRTVLLTPAGVPPPQGNIIFNPTGGQAGSGPVALLPPTPPDPDKPHDIPLLLPTLNEACKITQPSHAECVQRRSQEEHVSRIMGQSLEQQAESIQAVLLALLRAVEGQLQARNREDISRRLEVLHQMWTEHKLSDGVTHSMIMLVVSLDMGLYDKADEVHVGLMCDHVTEVSQWMVGIKRLIHGARKVPPVQFLHMTHDSEKEKETAVSTVVVADGGMTVLPTSDGMKSMLQEDKTINSTPTLEDTSSADTTTDDSSQQRKNIGGEAELQAPPSVTESTSGPVENDTSVFADTVEVRLDESVATL